MILYILYNCTSTWTFINWSFFHFINTFRSNKIITYGNWIVIFSVTTLIPLISLSLKSYHFKSYHDIKCHQNINKNIFYPSCQLFTIWFGQCHVYLTGNNRAEIIPTASFDREQQKSYRIPILVGDNPGANPASLQATTYFTVVIGDENDNNMADGSSVIRVFNYEVGLVHDTKKGEEDILQLVKTVFRRYLAHWIGVRLHFVQSNF